MSWISKSILFFNALVLLVGSVGINIFRHTCAEDGTMTSYFVNTEEHCSKNSAKDIPSCCQEKCSREKSTLKKDCCSDAFSYLHYQPLDYFQSDSPRYASLSAGQILTPIATVAFFEKEVQAVKTEIVKPHPPPDRRFGINLLLYHGILRL